MSVETSNLILTEQQFREYSNMVLGVLRTPTIWKSIFPRVDVGGFGKTEYEYYTISDVGPIIVDWDGQSENYTLAPVNISRKKIPVFHKEVFLGKRELESSKYSGLGGIPDLLARTSNEIALKLNQKVDEAIGLGISTPVESQAVIQQVADAGGGNDWGTPSNIMIDTALNQSTLMGNDFYGPYLSVHYHTLASSLIQVIGNTDSTYLSWVNKVATLGNYYTKNITNNSGTQASGTDAVQLLLQPTIGDSNNTTILNYGLLVGQDWTIDDLGPVWGIKYKIYGAMIHHMFRTNAGAAVDGITDLAN